MSKNVTCPSVAFRNASSQKKATVILHGLTWLAAPLSRAWWCSIVPPPAKLFSSIAIDWNWPSMHFKAVQITSIAYSLHCVALSLLFPRTVQPIMSNDVTIVVGSSLLVVNILGSCFSASLHLHSNVLLLFCCLSLFTVLSTLSATVSRRYRGCAMWQPGSQRSLTFAECSWIPTRLHPASPPSLHFSLDVLPVSTIKTLRM